MTKEAKAEVRLETKVERSLGWLQMDLLLIAWEKRIECLVDGKSGSIAGG